MSQPFSLSPILRARLIQTTRRSVAPLGWAAAIGMWIVLIMGATVTNTGSQTGCGPSWPLCRGQFIPEFAVSTFIEFSHRTVVGIESVLIIAFGIAAWVIYGRRLEMRILIPTMVGFLFLQAGLGAWAVMAPQEPAVLALHFGVSLVAFAAVVLTFALVYEFKYNATKSASQVATPFSLPKTYTAAIWVTALFSYVVVYLGAYVRHSKADDACTGWPLCNGRVIPAFHGGAGTAFTHRFAALVLTLAVGSIVLWSRRVRHQRPDLYRLSLVGLGLVLLQAVSGALVAATGTDLFSALAHAGVVALFFADLCLLTLRATWLPADLLVTPPAAHASRQSPLGVAPLPGL